MAAAEMTGSTGRDGDDNLTDLLGNNKVWGREGNDRIIVGGGGDWISGGDGNDIVLGGGGNDMLLGGSGNDILVGGDGDDHVNGGTGLDLIIGGRGADHLIGGNDGDLLLAGYTDYDENVIALDRLLAEWTQPIDYTARVNNISTGGGSLVGLGVLLNDATSHDDNAFDTLHGNGDRDLFFYNFEGSGVKDKLNDWKGTGSQFETRLDID